MYKQRKVARKEKHRVQQAEKKATKQAAFAALSEEEQEKRREERRALIALRGAERDAHLAKLDAAEQRGPKLIVDLDFWGLMHPQERKSMVSQLAHCAGVNKRAAAPCALHFTRCGVSVSGGRVPDAKLVRPGAALSHSADRLLVPFSLSWSRGWTRNGTFRTCSFKGPLAETLKQMQPGWCNWRVRCHEADLSDAFAGDLASLVYLTADAEEEVAALEPGKGYVIGGLVDRNRHKRLCLDKAQQLGIKAARLPIGEHLALAGSKVRRYRNTIQLCDFVDGLHPSPTATVRRDSATTAVREVAVCVACRPPPRSPIL